MSLPRTLAAVAVLGLTLGLGPTPAGAADPGFTYPVLSEASDQKAGSILFYNFYTSDPADSRQDTEISITNTSTSSAAFMRLLFVDGDTGGVTGSTICLTATQTARFRTSEIHPGKTGYLVAVSMSGVTGCPEAFNQMLGRADVTLASGFRGALSAVGVAANYLGTYPGCDANSVFADLTFNNAFGGYNMLPRILELSNLPSRADTRTLLVVNRIGGSFTQGPADVDSMAGTLYDDAGTGFPYAVSQAAPQFRSELSNAFPATGTPFETVVPAGRTGWTKLGHATTDFAYLGAALFLAGGPGGALPSSRSQPVAPSAAVTGAVNLRAVSVVPFVQYKGFPVVPPSC
jgi:hypothetical protein